MPERGKGSTHARQSAFGVKRGHDSTVTPRPRRVWRNPTSWAGRSELCTEPARASIVHEDEDPYLVDEDGSRLIQDNDLRPASRLDHASEQSARP